MPISNPAPSSGGGSSSGYTMNKITSDTIVPDGYDHVCVGVFTAMDATVFTINGSSIAL